MAKKVTKTAQANLEPMRHSLAHIMAAAVQQLWPNAKFGVGPVIDNGFYYDFELPKALTPKDLPKIENMMHKIAKQNLAFTRYEVGIDEAISQHAKDGQTYKLELLQDLKKYGTTNLKDVDTTDLGVDSTVAKTTAVSYYKVGEFSDLCRGPHLENTSQIGAFKLERIAGAYWRGNEKNPMLQRIYGLAFATESDLNKFLKMREEASKRDHRILGPKLDLYFFHETAPGMAYWLPKGVGVYNELISFWRYEHRLAGYHETVSPLLNKRQLYDRSGHWEHYADNMFVAETPEGEYGIKPMNCPNAMIFYQHSRRSYRDLPLRIADTDVLHRYELSGTLNGLLRARAFRQDDAHIFVSEAGIKEEFGRILQLVERFYGIFGLEYSFRLGTRPAKFMGDKDIWDRAEQELIQILDENGQQYEIAEGDGAFYGPKIDIRMTDSLGRGWQMGTIQLDFQIPIKFGLTFTDADGKEKPPVAIHRVIYGSLERFIGILVEHYAGAFPLWLAPEQVRLVTVNDDKLVLDYARKVAQALSEVDIRVWLDESNESVGKKIRSAELAKIPVVLVIGDEERKSGKLKPRTKTGTVAAVSLDELIANLVTQIEAKS